MNDLPGAILEVYYPEIGPIDLAVTLSPPRPCPHCNRKIESIHDVALCGEIEEIKRMIKDMSLPIINLTDFPNGLILERK